MYISDAMVKKYSKSIKYFNFDNWVLEIPVDWG